MIKRLTESLINPRTITRAKAGIPVSKPFLDSRFRANGTSQRFLNAVICVIALCLGAAWAADDGKANDGRALDARIQGLKQEVMELNRDLLVLEEELLFPASTQVAVFVSMDVGTLFQLDSVQLKLDDTVVTNYLYTEREVQALHRGGVQRLYLGNLRAGKHELIAVFTGKGPHDRDYRRGATLTFEKTTGPKYIELQIRDETRSQQPEFRVKEWQ